MLRELSNQVTRCSRIKQITRHHTSQLDWNPAPWLRSTGVPVGARAEPAAPVVRNYELNARDHRHNEPLA
jgi:hypothetical protein